jgi:hypothetical protein
MPTRIGRVLGVLRKLIDYGRQLAVTVQQRAPAPGFAFLTRAFGTAELAIILARITSGLRRAAALEASLCQRAVRGRDLTVASASPTTTRASCLTIRAAPPDALPESRRPAVMEDSRLARLPTEKEIAAEVRRRPVGAVIVDICRDLGIMPGQLDRAFWDELAHAIIAYGGSLTAFLDTLNKRLSAFGSGEHARDAIPGWPTAPPRLPALATGPP